MRFAAIATTAAAIVAVPFAMGATAPQMSGEEFVSAVRCTAYEDAADPSARLEEAKYQLNSEARRQAPETTALAREEARDAARQAVSGADANLAASCGAQIAARRADAA